MAYTVHNIYCALESYFVRVAKFFENDLDSRTWQADLVGRMAVEIRGLRPRFLDARLMADIDDLRRFRHAFRNVYGSGLDPARVTGIQARLPGALAAFGAAHSGFVESLRVLGREADGVGDGPRKGGE